MAVSAPNFADPSLLDRMGPKCRNRCHRPLQGRTKAPGALLLLVLVDAVDAQPVGEALARQQHPQAVALARMSDYSAVSICLAARARPKCCSGAHCHAYVTVGRGGKHLAKRSCPDGGRQHDHRHLAHDVARRSDASFGQLTLVNRRSGARGLGRPPQVSLELIGNKYAK